ncbi:MAG: YqeG family HAD IIIA-type phosphatase [Erysipelotrichaceae bacterium]
MFKPDMYIRIYKDLNLELLEEQHIKLIICDIDNTLAPHNIDIASDEAISFINTIVERGIKVVLVSNNTNKRVTRFTRTTALKAYSFALKPMKHTYKQILRDYALTSEQVAILGDQLLTDVLGGKLMGFKCILCTPLVKQDISWTKILRVVENIIYKKLEKKKLLERGKYYE